MPSITGSGLVLDALLSTLMVILRREPGATGDVVMSSLSPVGDADVDGRHRGDGEGRVAVFHRQFDA